MYIYAHVYMYIYATCIHTHIYATCIPVHIYATCIHVYIRPMYTSQSPIPTKPTDPLAQGGNSNG